MSHAERIFEMRSACKILVIIMKNTAQSESLHVRRVSKTSLKLHQPYGRNVLCLERYLGCGDPDNHLDDISEFDTKLYVVSKNICTVLANNVVRFSCQSKVISHIYY